MNLHQVRIFVIRPSLQRIGLWSPAAENLVLGTGLVESQFEFVDQVGNVDAPGPAYGPFQMEKATHDDIWDNYLQHNIGLATLVKGLSGSWESVFPSVTELWGNFYYATAMCRVHYRRVPQDLPIANEPVAMALYWKTHYNTHKGKGDVREAIPWFQKACV